MLDIIHTKGVSRILTQLIVVRAFTLVENFLSLDHHFFLGGRGGGESVSTAYVKQSLVERYYYYYQIYLKDTLTPPNNMLVYRRGAYKEK